MRILGWRIHSTAMVAYNCARAGRHSGVGGGFTPAPACRIELEQLSQGTIILEEYRIVKWVIGGRLRFTIFMSEDPRRRCAPTVRRARLTLQRGTWWQQRNLI